MRTAPLAVLFFAGALFAASATSCRSARESASPDHDYVLVYLMEGPHLAQQTKEESAQIFAGHMANIQRLADAGELIIAGPFDAPHDKRMRGIFVMDAASVEIAATLVATDPGVKAGVFAPAMFPMRASSSLKRAPLLDREDKARLANSGQAAGPAANIRGYVMLTAEDARRAERALADLAARHRVIWSGRLADGRGVFVLDAMDVALAETLIATERDAIGLHTLDAWWSTKSLERLPTAAL